MTSYFCCKKLTFVCLKMLSGLPSFWRRAKNIGTVKNVRITTKPSLCDNMMFIYKITGVKICGSLCEHHHVSFVENDTAAHTWYRPCLGPHRKLILTAILLIFSPKKSYNNVHSENRKINILIKIPYGPSLRDPAQLFINTC